MTTDEPNAGRFPTTAWSVLRDLPDRESPEFRAAMDPLIAAYWRPVVAFLRARGHPVHEAEDLTQAFFARAFERDWLRRADPARGRFRTFLLAVLARFVADQGPKRASRQQGF